MKLSQFSLLAGLIALSVQAVPNSKFQDLQSAYAKGRPVLTKEIRDKDIRVGNCVHPNDTFELSALVSLEEKTDSYLFGLFHLTSLQQVANVDWPGMRDMFRKIFTPVSYLAPADPVSFQNLDHTGQLVGLSSGLKEVPIQNQAYWLVAQTCTLSPQISVGCQKGGQAPVKNGSVVQYCLVDQLAVGAPAPVAPPVAPPSPAVYPVATAPVVAPAVPPAPAPVAPTVTAPPAVVPTPRPAVVPPPAKPTRFEDL